jgi:hypothetical protein
MIRSKKKCWDLFLHKEEELVGQIVEVVNYNNKLDIGKNNTQTAFYNSYQETYRDGLIIRRGKYDDYLLKGSRWIVLEYKFVDNPIPQLSEQYVIANLRNPKYQVVVGDYALLDSTKLITA